MLAQVRRPGKMRKCSLSAGLNVGASLVALVVQNPPAKAGDAGLIPGREDPLEEGVATQSRIPAWSIPCTEEPGGLQSVRSQSVGHS